MKRHDKHGDDEIMIHQPSITAIELVDAIQAASLVIVGFLLISAAIALAWREIRDKHGDSRRDS